ncbi:LAGLIDADG family homing endonuclease [Candidatus Bathyarchaeota archaeon]|nr:LAGLIDADG family homing endonuclease [Candidatus Bathyarchaeota archaeon]
MPEILYLAGFFDGEGCISIHRHADRKTKRGFVLVPRITITNTKKEIIEWFEPFGFSNRCITNGKNANILYRTELERLEAVRAFLQKMSLVLTLKRKQADLVLEFCNSRLENRTYCYTERELKIREELQILNKRGRN